VYQNQAFKTFYSKAFFISMAKHTKQFLNKKTFTKGDIGINKEGNASSR
jgi:hypothetical protein